MLPCLHDAELCIRAHSRGQFYPIDWPQVSHWVRLVRAQGRCQVCGRPHGETVRHLGDGRWWDQEQAGLAGWKGRKVPSPVLTEDAPIRTTKVVLAAAHLDHDPAHCGGIATAMSERCAERWAGCG